MGFEVGCQAVHRTFDELPYFNPVLLGGFFQRFLPVEGRRTQYMQASAQGFFPVGKHLLLEKVPEFIKQDLVHVAVPVAA